MRDSWITEVGETGLVRLTERDGSWFVTNPSTEQETKCILQGEFNIPEDDQSAEIKIRSAKFISSDGNGSNYLFAEPTSESEADKLSGTESISDNSVEGGSTGSASETETTTKSTDTRTGPKRTSLTDLSGSSEYVTVEAIVNEVFCVNKDESDIPDIIGALKDENTGERRTFIVNDGVNHPYLEEGRRFLFRNAVDHCYKKKDQVQLMITQYTEFSDLGFPHTSTPSSGQSRSRKSSNSSSSGEKSLGQIAQSMLGDEEFTMTEGRESAISKAKKKAKRQQRDPAIDPKLNDK